MPVKSVIRMGESDLLKVAEPVDKFDEALQQLIVDLEDTMHAMGGAGIAAPQIGISQRVLIFGHKEPIQNPRYPDAEHVPFTVLINPEVTPTGNTMTEGWEGCLSVPGLRGLVPRFDAVEYKGFDQYGKAIHRKVSGFHARVIQHEFDHLNGVLYPMRIKDLKNFGYSDVIFPEQSVPVD